jgi:glutamine synthetase
MILDRFAVLDLHPVVGFEMEFYLADPQGGNDGKPDAPASPLTGAKPIHDGVFAIDEVNDQDSLINEIYAACKLQMIEADTTISEAGLGQFEINLVHSHDAMKAADDAAFFKQIAKGVARKYGLAASFMAKPYSDRPGNGMHLHISLVDGKGKNVFDDGSDAGSPVLGHGLAGALAGLADSMLIFAPHQNSYRRLAIESHAPMAVCWGYENRTAALRVPLGPPSQRRIEHRVSGADANPYLVLAAILGAILNGLEDQQPPPPPITSSSYALDLPALPSSWGDAINHFTNSTAITRTLPKALCDMLIGCKKQELQRFSGDISPFEYHSYLDQV